MKAIILKSSSENVISVESSMLKLIIETGKKIRLWHIMKNYSFHVINVLFICCSYWGYVLEGYFQNYFQHISDATPHLSSSRA